MNNPNLPELSSGALDAATEAYMNVHAMDLCDDALWDETRDHVRELIVSGTWNPSGDSDV